ncbi:unnamed protein product, partial [Prorocentrum cordatum]
VAASEAAVPGECRLLADLVGRPTQCVCQCDCRCETQATAGGWTAARLLLYVVPLLVGASAAGLCIGRGASREPAPSRVTSEIITTVGDRVFVCYHQDADGAVVEWHERLLLAQIVGVNWVVISRDFDIFEENFAESDVLNKFGAGGALPPALRGLAVYRIDQFALGKHMQYYMDTGEALAKGLRPAGAGADAAPAPPGKGGPPATPAGTWVAAKSRGGVKVGDSLLAQMGEWAHVVNDRCLFILTDGVVLSGGLEDSLVKEGAVAVSASRILPVKRAGMRRFRRPFAEALHAMKEGPVQRHYRWRSVLGAGNLAAFELISRRYRLWGSACKDLLREVDARSASGDDLLNERWLFLGVKNLRISVVVMPVLGDFVAKELSTRAAVLRSARVVPAARACLRVSDDVPDNSRQLRDVDPEVAPQAWLARVRAEARKRLLGLAPELTPLQQERARPSAQQGYCRALERLASFLERRPLRGWSAPQWDRRLLSFVEWAKAAVWGRAPATSRPPLARGVVLALAWAMLPSCPVGALAVVVMFETYLRPSGLLSLAVAQLVPPASQGGAGPAGPSAFSWGGLGRPSKTRQFDFGALLDLERRGALTPALRVLLGCAAPSRTPVEQLGVYSVEPTLGALRRGGAGRDRLVQARFLGEVRQRGHWRSFRSVARCDRRARASLQIGEFPMAVQAEIAALGVLPNTSLVLVVDFGKVGTEAVSS